MRGIYCDSNGTDHPALIFNVDAATNMASVAVIQDGAVKTHKKVQPYTGVISHEPREIKFTKRGKAYTQTITSPHRIAGQPYWRR